MNPIGPAALDERIGLKSTIEVGAVCRSFDTTPSSMKSVPAASWTTTLIFVEKKVEISCCFPKGAMSLLLLL